MKKEAAEAVYLDTEVFVRHQFDFRHQVFAQLKCAVDHNRAEVVLTAVTQREVERRIRDAVEQGHSSLRTALHKHPIVMRSGSPNPEQLLDDKTRKSWSLTATLPFQRFLLEAAVRVLPVDEVSMADILSQYFLQAPPFGPGKKRKEFPDAIAAQALMAWRMTAGRRLVVVSGDDDWKRFCERHSIEHHASLSAYVNSRQDPALVKGILEALERRWEEMLSGIQGQIADRIFDISDVSGDLEGVELQDGRLVSCYVLGQQGEMVAVELLVDVDLKAHATYEEPGTGYYDKEVDRWFMVESTTEEIERTAVFKVEVLFDCEDGALPTAPIDSLVITEWPSINIFTHEM